MKISQSNELPVNLYWFRGFHLDQIVEQLGYSKSEIIGALSVMNDYWIDSCDRKPTNPVLNSAVHSTDIGTNPTEEVCVNNLAMASAGLLPDRYKYWNTWIDKVNSYWSRWEKQQ